MTNHTHEQCPYCEHDECYSEDDETGVFFCFSCGAKPSDIPNDKRKYLYYDNSEEESGVRLETYVKDNYRGISRQVLEKFGVYFTKNNGKETVHYKYKNGTKHRELPKSITISGKVDHFYGQEDYNGGGKTLTITEGEEDRLSVIQMMGDYPCVSVPNASPSKDFWKNAQEYLQGWEQIKLSIDNDHAGNKLADKFATLFPGKVYRVPHTKYKDANDFITSGAREEYKRAWWNAQRIKPDNILCTKEDLIRLYEHTPNYEYCPTGIDELDEKILGLHKGALTIIVAPTGLGKSLAPYTPVLRYDGKVVKAIDVKVGDQLMGPDSKPRNVTNVNLQKGPMYRVTPTKGDPFDCNEDHILSLKHTTTNEVKNVVLKDYLSWSKTQKHLWKLWRVGFNTNRGSESYDSISFSYAVGAYLGDGCKHNPRFTMGKKKQKVIDYLIEHGQLKPTKVTFDRGCYSLPFSKGDKLWYYLDSMGALEVRHIPHELKVGTSIIRSHVLSGLLDTDGSLTLGGAEITQKSEVLADDICFVARSLGLAAYKKAKCVSGKVYFRVNISGDMTFLPTNRLKFKPRAQKKDVLKTGFSVEYIGEGVYRGIALDGDHLFLLGDFTVTHNTEVMRYLEYQVLSSSNYSIAACHLEETPLRSVLGLVSYQLGKNLTRKDLVEKAGMENDVYKAMEDLTKGERYYYFNMATHEGPDDLIDKIRFLVTAMGVDYVFFEPVQDVVTGNVSDKESILSDLSNKLKRLAPELNVGIIVVAHANDEGDTKYCKTIAQSASFEIRLERDMNAETELERNRTYVSVGRKNRVGGGSGPAGTLLFDKETYMLTPEVSFKDMSNETEVGF
jgi:replicative DNA helicase